MRVYLPLETFLVEWKLLERVEPDRVGVLP